MIYSQRAVVPLGLFRSRVTDSLLYFLNRFGISIEDIILEAVRVVLLSPHQVPYERFEIYLDTAGLDAGFESAYWNSEESGNPVPVTYQDLSQKFIDTVYLMYSLNFPYLRAAFGCMPYDDTQYWVEFTDVPRYLGEDIIVSIGIHVDSDGSLSPRRIGCI